LNKSPLDLIAFAHPKKGLFLKTSTVIPAKRRTSITMEDIGSKVQLQIKYNYA